MIPTHVTQYVLEHRQHISRICFWGWQQKFLNISTNVESNVIDGGQQNETKFKLLYHEI